MKQNLKGFVKFLCLGLFFGLISYGVHVSSEIRKEKYYEGNYVFSIYRQNLELDYYGAKDTLVDAIDSYIKEIAPSSVMNALTFVNKCDEHGMDLFFVLSQAQIESSFCTAGLGAKMNSAFNVKAYDGQGSKHMTKESHPDESIEPYIKLIKTDYLGENKTEMDLMNKFVNLAGKRYATDPNYEAKMLSTYDKLTTRYGDLYREYRKFKTLANM